MDEYKKHSPRNKNEGRMLKLWEIHSRLKIERKAGFCGGGSAYTKESVAMLNVGTMSVMRNGMMARSRRTNKFVIVVAVGMVIELSRHSIVHQRGECSFCC